MLKPIVIITSCSILFDILKQILLISKVSVLFFNENIKQKKFSEKKHNGVFCFPQLPNF